MANLTQTTTMGTQVWGKTNTAVVALNPLPADYVTGGYPLTPGQNIALAAIYGVLCIAGQGGYHPSWNPTTQSLEIYQQSAATGRLTQVPAGTDLSAFTFLLLIFGS